MKKTVTLYFLVIFFAGKFVAAQTLPLNGGFENWTSVVPDNWTMQGGSISMVAGYLSPNAVLLGSGFDGMFWQGSAIYQNDTTNVKPLSISGFWMSNSANAFIQVNVYDSFSNVIGSVSFSSLLNVTSWTSFSYPISYNSNAIPAVTSIIISSLVGSGP